MKKYIVEFRYESNVIMEVEAESEEEARNIAGSDKDLLAKINRKLELWDEFITEVKK